MIFLLLFFSSPARLNPANPKAGQQQQQSSLARRDESPLGRRANNTATAATAANGGGVCNGKQKTIPDSNSSTPYCSASAAAVPVVAKNGVLIDDIEAGSGVGALPDLLDPNQAAIECRLNVLRWNARCRPVILFLTILFYFQEQHLMKLVS